MLCRIFKNARGERFCLWPTNFESGAEKKFILGIMEGAVATRTGIGYDSQDEAIKALSEKGFWMGSRRQLVVMR